MDFKNYIEDMVVANQPCRIVFSSTNGAIVNIEAVITDFYTDGGESFLVTDKGFRINLQDIKHVNDWPKGFC